MAVTTQTVLLIYARNVEMCAFKRGWSKQQLATRLGLSINALNRIYFARSRYLDPFVLMDLTHLFGCTPNDLLLPQADIDYGIPASPSPKVQASAPL